MKSGQGQMSSAESEEWTDCQADRPTDRYLKDPSSL